MPPDGTTGWSTPTVTVTNTYQTYTFEFSTLTRTAGSEPLDLTNAQPKFIVRKNSQTGQARFDFDQVVLVGGGGSGYELTPVVLHPPPNGDAIVVRGQSEPGVFYGLQTLLQSIQPDGSVPLGEIIDWPDLPLRMVMMDAARQNQNEDYYRRVIRFLARYKVNVLHWHLTDDETLSLYHEDYPWLMHPHAWRAEPVRSLVAFARRYHVEVIPEIESLGHARVFTRHPRFSDILHQTRFDQPSQSWAGTDVPGFPNVLCPASEEAYDYLARMYTRAAELFPNPLLHVGCDEVEQTACARCAEKFPGLSTDEWFQRHLLRCVQLTSAHQRRAAVWSDMLLHHPGALDGLDRRSVVIFDWHYNADVSPESAASLKTKGFEVVACPALVCYPRMILPDADNYRNIERFTRIARELDLLGVDATVWTPTRYMSDALWTGIAYAAVHAWSGSNWNEDRFYRSFAADFFGLADADPFARFWVDLYNIPWWLNDLEQACWIDDAGLEQARATAQQRGQEVRGYLDRLRLIQQEWAALGGGVTRNQQAWTAIEQSAAVRAYTMEHLLAAPRVRSAGTWNLDLVRQLDQRCVQAMQWIEGDWDRNAFADDPNKDGAFTGRQNLLLRFRQMHRYHQRILSEPPASRPALLDRESLLDPVPRRPPERIPA